jgi:hypothetical protein
MPRGAVPNPEPATVTTPPEALIELITTSGTTINTASLLIWVPFTTLISYFPAASVHGMVTTIESEVREVGCKVIEPFNTTTPFTTVPPVTLAKPTPPMVSSVS